MEVEIYFVDLTTEVSKLRVTLPKWFLFKSGILKYF